MRRSLFMASDSLSATPQHTLKKKVIPRKGVAAGRGLCSVGRTCLSVHRFIQPSESTLPPQISHYFHTFTQSHHPIRLQ